jgi:IS30 family transposase
MRRGAPLVGLGEIVMILELHRQGVSVSAIARQVGLDRKTVSTDIRNWTLFDIEK